MVFSIVRIGSIRRKKPVTPLPPAPPTAAAPATTQPLPPSSTDRGPACPPLMKPGYDARSEAVNFLGQLRHHEDSLAAWLKATVKSSPQHVHDVFTCLVDEWTPLHACTLRGARRLVKMALKAGVDPNLEYGAPEQLPSRCAPLHLAAHRGDVSLIQLLVQAGASLDKRDSSGRTPLYYAANNNNVLAARKLLKYGADPAHLTDQQRLYYSHVTSSRPPRLLCIPSTSHGDAT